MRINVTEETVIVYSVMVIMIQLLYLAFCTNVQHCMYKCNTIRMTLKFITNNYTSTYLVLMFPLSRVTDHPCYDIWMQNMDFA